MLKMQILYRTSITYILFCLQILPKIYHFCTHPILSHKKFIFQKPFYRFRVKSSEFQKLIFNIFNPEVFTEFKNVFSIIYEKTQSIDVRMGIPSYN
jgi:hypothetical protein